MTPLARSPPPDDDEAVGGFFVAGGRLVDVGEDLGDDADGNLLRCLRPDVQADGTEEAAKFFCAEEREIEALCLLWRDPRTPR